MENVCTAGTDGTARPHVKEGTRTRTVRCGGALIDHATRGEFLVFALTGAVEVRAVFWQQ